MAPLPVATSTDALPPPAGDHQPQRLSSPNIPEAAFTTAALYERGKTMLTGEGERPVASGDTRRAAAATLELILSVCVAAEQLWDDCEDDIRRCCAPWTPTGLIDGREVFAYLLADVLGRPLLHPADTHGVAQRGANGVAKARKQTGGQKIAKASYNAAVRIAARAAADGAPPAAAVAYAKLLETYDLKLPSRTVGRRVRSADTATDPVPAEVTGQQLPVSEVTPAET